MRETTGNTTPEQARKLLFNATKGKYVFRVETNGFSLGSIFYPTESLTDSQIFAYLGIRRV